jgi:hypothetical protein
MQAKHGKPPRSGRLKTTGVELSWEAQVRLSWMDFYRQTENAALTCRHSGSRGGHSIARAAVMTRWI